MELGHVTPSQPNLVSTPEEHEKRILLDVDGTCTIGPGPTLDSFAPLQPGIREFLGALKDRGFEIIIFSARSQQEAIKKFFRDNDLDRYVDGYSRTKLPSRIILDNRAVTFKGSLTQALADIDSFDPYGVENEHNFSSVMAILPDEIGREVRSIASRIPDGDLAEKGRESEPHVTVKWGIHGDNSDGAQKAASGHKDISASMGGLSLFELPEHDVLKIDVESPDLHLVNSSINRECPHTDTHQEYHPHVTVAYLKPGKGAKYVGSSGLEGKSFKVRSLVFSDRRNRREEIPIR